MKLIRASAVGHKYKFMTKLFQPSGMAAYEWFIIAISSVIKVQSCWCKDVYLEICHVYSNVGSFITLITTLDVEEELCWKSCIVINRMKTTTLNFFNFFQTHFPKIDTSNGLAISADGDKGILLSVQNLLPNSIFMRCIFQLENVSRNILYPGRRHL